MKKSLLIGLILGGIGLLGVGILIGYSLGINGSNTTGDEPQINKDLTRYSGKYQSTSNVGSGWLDLYVDGTCKVDNIRKRDHIASGREGGGVEFTYPKEHICEWTIEDDIITTKITYNTDLKKNYTDPNPKEGKNECDSLNGKFSDNSKTRNELKSSAKNQSEKKIYDESYPDICYYKGDVTSEDTYMILDNQNLLDEYYKGTFNKIKTYQ